MRIYKTQGEAAEKFKLSKRSITNATGILGGDSSAVPSLRQAFLSEKVAASDRARIVDEPPGVQERAVEMKLSGESRTVAGAVEFIKEEMVVLEDAVWPAAFSESVAAGTASLRVSPLTGLEHWIDPASVDVIITFPPADARKGSMLSDLSALAVHSLKRSGSMLELTGTEHLCEILEQLRHDELSWICAFHYTHPGRSSNSRSSHNIPSTQKLLLVFGKDEFRLTAGYDRSSLHLHLRALLRTPRVLV